MAIPAAESCVYVIVVVVFVLAQVGIGVGIKVGANVGIGVGRLPTKHSRTKQFQFNLFAVSVFFTLCTIVEGDTP